MGSEVTLYRERPVGRQAEQGVQIRRECHMQPFKPLVNDTGRQRDLERTYIDCFYVGGHERRVPNNRTKRAICDDLRAEMMAAGYPWHSGDYEIVARDSHIGKWKSQAEGLVEGVELEGVEFHDVSGAVFDLVPAMYHHRLLCNRTIILGVDERMLMVFQLNSPTAADLADPGFLHNYDGVDRLAIADEPRRVVAPKLRQMVEDGHDKWKRETLEWLKTATCVPDKQNMVDWVLKSTEANEKHIQARLMFYYQQSQKKVSDETLSKRVSLLDWVFGD